MTEQNFSLEPILYLNDEGVECTEEWKPIRGFESYYAVSDLGRFKAFDRVITRHNGVKEFKPARILKNLYYSNGYTQLMFYVEKKRSTFIAHRVVAEHFIPNPENLPLVNHRNGIKDDNKVSNLEWCTRSYNMLHAIENKLIDKKKIQGSNNVKAKLTEDMVKDIRANYTKGKINKTLYLEKYSHLITEKTFQKIALGDGWKHV